MNIDRSANDDTPEALAAAANNWRVLVKATVSLHHADQWCGCRKQDDIAYYRDPVSGSHGWLCCQCLCIVQTG